jgi:hypothetical protein
MIRTMGKTAVARQERLDIGVGDAGTTRLHHNIDALLPVQRNARSNMTPRSIPPAIILFFLTACSGGTTGTAAHAPPDGEAGSGPAVKPPPIHYEQTAVLTMDGQPALEHAYRKMLADCQHANLPIHALTPDEEAKLERTHVEAWIGPDKLSHHEQRWNIKDSPACQFSIVLEYDVTEIQDSSGHATVIDGVEHTVEVQELGKWAPVVALPASDGELTEVERASGFIKHGTATANAAECAVWEDRSGNQFCVWSGGRQWGYSADGADPLHDGVSGGNSITLWAHPGPTSGWKLETKVFTVGVPLDERAFAIPGGLTSK